MIINYRKIQPVLRVEDKVARGKVILTLPVGTTFTVFQKTLYNSKHYSEELQLSSGLSLVTTVSKYEYILKVEAEGFNTASVIITRAKSDTEAEQDLQSGTMLIYGAPVTNVRASSGTVRASSGTVRADGSTNV
jgi:hypothetical protein